MHPVDPVQRWNTRLDRLPREHVFLTGRPVPAFRAMGVTGYHLALGSVLIGAVLVRRPLVVAVGVALVCAASFFGWALLRRRLTGRESLVLLEHVWIAVAASGCFVWLIGEPVWTWLDLLAVALAPFLLCGRIGCLLAGCCHGQPAALGVVYQRENHPARGVRLFPVAALEATGLAALTLLGWLLLAREAAGTGRPGDVVVALGVGYAVLRFATEGLRGDVRPRALGVPVARGMAAVQFLVVVATDAAFRTPDLRAAQWIPAAALLAAAAIAGLRWRRASPLDTASVLAVRAAADRPAAESPVLLELGDGVSVATSTTHAGRHVSVAVDDDQDGVAQRLSSAAFQRDPDAVGARGVAHTSWHHDDRRGYFDDRPA